MPRNLKYIFVGLMLGGFALTVWAIYPSALGADPRDPEQVALGQKIYDTNCASCHGVNLEGETNDWKIKKPDGFLPAPPHNDEGHTWHHDDSLLFNYTKKGGNEVIPGNFQSGMPGFGEVLSDEEIWAALTYIKSNWSKQNLERQEKMSAMARNN